MLQDSGHQAGQFSENGYQEHLAVGPWSFHLLCERCFLSLWSLLSPGLLHACLWVLKSSGAAFGDHILQRGDEAPSFPYKERSDLYQEKNMYPFSFLPSGPSLEPVKLFL